MNVFEEIYKQDAWGFGSGHGSLYSVTKGYTKFLEMFIAKNDVKSVVDYGCGDWQFSKYIDWSGVHYTGLEVVESLVESHNKTYAKKNIEFKRSPTDPSKIPAADLLIVKDVLQHINSHDVKKFFAEAVPKFKFALITNNFIPLKDQNKEIETGSFRPLDIRQPPFSVSATAVHTLGRSRRTYSIKHRQSFDPWEEVVLLVDNTRKINQKK